MAAGQPKELTPFQASYHWRNKDCYPWSAEWITSVPTVEGDVDLGQRKGKLLTIYDVRIVVEYRVSKGDEGETVTGQITIPEVSHDCLDGLSEYTYEYSSIDDLQVSAFVRSAAPSLLETKFNEFPRALVAAHGHDGQAVAGNSGSSTPIASTSRYSPLPPGEIRQKAEEKPAAKNEAKSVNTATVTAEARLAASADDLWELLTDERKIPMWARSPAKSSTTPDAPFELFGGNVRGVIKSADRPKTLVQSWQIRSPNWPDAHYATMTTSFDQGSDDTKVTFKLVGVPLGQEETIQNALETYYIRSLKQMGLVTSSSAAKITYQSRLPLKQQTQSKKAISQRKKAKRDSKKESHMSAVDVAGYAVVGALVAGLVGIVWSSFPSRP